MDSALHDFFEQKKIGAEHEKSIVDWTIKASLRAKQLILATHNGKYTHSGTQKEVSCIAKARQALNDGYFRTGNCDISTIDSLKHLDCLGNAAALDVYSFLSLQLQDGRSVFDHIGERSDYLRVMLELEKNIYDEVCENFLEIMPKNRELQTSDLIKQIYFPVGDGYHLLSILTASCLITEMKLRIDRDIRFSSHNKQGREARRKGIQHPGYAELFNITEIAYGGANARNVGVLNNRHRGSSYLLSSTPPSLPKRHTKLPRRNFFTECLLKRDFEELFTSLYKIFGTDYNNLAIREARERIYETIIDRIIQKAWVLQELDGGWSEREYYGFLPTYQKLWLDAANAEERSDFDTWFPLCAEEMTRWICSYVPMSWGAKANPLGSEEFSYVHGLIEDAKEAFL